MAMPQHITAQMLRDPRYQLAQALTKQGTSTAPVQHWMQGAARLGQALAGTLKGNRVREEYDDKSKAYSTALANALKGENPYQTLAQSGDRELMQMGVQGQLQDRRWQQQQAAEQARIADERAWRDQQMQQQQAFQREMLGARLAARPGPTTYDVITGDEAGALGLNPANVYQRGSNGQLSLLSEPNVPQYNVLSDEEVEAMGLPPGSYQRSRDGKISTIGGGGQTFNFMPPELVEQAGLPEGTVAQMGADGKVNVISKPSDTTTGTQKSAGGYLMRMQNAEELVSEIGDEGVRDTGDYVAGGVPIIGGWLQRQTMTPEQQMYANAAQEWIRAKLRKESGAVIGADEMAQEYETYFPMPGDSPQVIAQKRKLRQRAMESIAGEAGEAAPTERPVTQSPETGGWGIQRID